MSTEGTIPKFQPWTLERVHMGFPSLVWDLRLWEQRLTLYFSFFFLTFYLCKEQTFGLCGRRRGWDDLREYHWNMYITICETDRQSRFSAWDRVLRAGALGWPWGMWWGRGSWWGTHVHPWLIHVNVWQKPLQYCKVINFQLKWLN